MLSTIQLTGLVGCLLAGLTTAQSTTSAPATENRPQIQILGASLSAGTSLSSFGVKGKPAYRYETIGLAAVIGAGYPNAKPAVSDCSDTWFFQQPISKGKRQIATIAKGSDGILLAIDLPFWYGYGKPPKDLDGDEEDVVEWRLEQQQSGFAILETLLDRFDGIVVLGDYPDMHGANPMMLPKSMIPEVDTQAELNARLGAWAEGHDRVRIFPLAATLVQIRAKARTVTVHDQRYQVKLKHLLQVDKLHPTRLGVAILMVDLFGWMQTNLPATLRERPTELSLSEAVDRCKAGPILATIGARASQPSKAGKRP